MRRDEIVSKVEQQAQWWIDTRVDKVRQARHDTMEVNPFMAPLIAAIHGHESFADLSEFLIGGHFLTGHATGFGKLIDEKILPRVFGTTKLDKKTRSEGITNKSCFDNIDHIVAKGSDEVLLSLKASKWTIQLGQALNLNKDFHQIRELRGSGDHDYAGIVLATFYGAAGGLTDKYRLVRGISYGANHDVIDITDYVEVRSGKDFWSWLGDDPDTQYWVLEGIEAAIASKRESLEDSQDLLEKFRESFIEKYSKHLDDDAEIDWRSVLKDANGK